MGFNAGALTAYLKLDTSEFDAALAAAEAQAEAFPKEIRTTAVADTAEADAAVAETSALLDALDHQEAQPTVSIDSAPFQAEAAAIEAEKAILEEPIDMTANLNSNGAAAEASALGQTIGRAISQGVGEGAGGGTGAAAQAIASSTQSQVSSLVSLLAREGAAAGEIRAALAGMGLTPGEIGPALSAAMMSNPAIAGALMASERALAMGVQDASIAIAKQFILGGETDLNVVARGLQGVIGGTFRDALATSKLALSGTVADSAAAALAAAQAEALNAELEAARTQALSIFSAIAAADAARAVAGSGLSLPFTSLAGGALGAADPLGWARSVPMGALGAGAIPKALGMGMPALGMGAAPMGELGPGWSSIPLDMAHIGPFALGPAGSSTSTAMELYQYAALGEAMAGGGGGGGGSSGGWGSAFGNFINRTVNRGGGSGGSGGLLGGLLGGGGSSSGGIFSRLFGGLGPLLGGGAGFKQLFTGQPIPTTSLAGKWAKFLTGKFAKDNLLNNNILPKGMATGIGKMGAIPLGALLGGLSGVGPAVGGAAGAALGGLLAAGSIAGAGSLGFALLAKNAYTNFSTALEGQQQLQALGAKYGKNSQIYQTAAQQYATATATTPAIALSTAAQAVPLVNNLSAAFDKLSTPIYGVFLNFIKGLTAALPVLLPFLRTATNAWTGFLNSISKGMGSTGFASFMKQITVFEGPVMKSIGGIIDNLAHAFASFVLLFAPVGERMFADLDKWTKSFANFMAHVKFGPGFLAAMTTVGHDLSAVGDAVMAFVQKVGKATVPIGLVILHFIANLAKYVTQFFKALPSNYATLLAGLVVGLIAVSKIGMGGSAVLAILLGLGELMKVLKINVTPTEAKIITDIGVAITGLYLAAKLAASITAATSIFFKVIAGTALTDAEAATGIAKLATAFKWGFGMMGTAYTGFVGILDTIGLAEYANPILAILGLLALAAIVLITHWETVSQNLESVWKTILHWFDWGVNALSPIINNGINMVNDLITAFNFVSKLVGGPVVSLIPLLNGKLNQVHHYSTSSLPFGPTYHGTSSLPYGPSYPGGSKSVNVTIHTGASSSDVHSAVASILPHIVRAMG